MIKATNYWKSKFILVLILITLIIGIAWIVGYILMNSDTTPSRAVYVQNSI